MVARGALQRTLCGPRAYFCTSAQRQSAWPTAPSTPSTQAVPKPAITVASLLKQKAAQEPITCITAYDNPTALSVRAAGADMCLVGDSLANVALGYASTRSLTLDAMIHHGRAVSAAVHAPALDMDPACPPAPFVVIDMPFGSCNISIDDGMRNVVRVIQETRAPAVKMEGSLELVPLIRKLNGAGISVMGHIGLQPQRFGDANSFRVQGTDADSACAIYEAARALEDAGCFSIVLECIPAKLGEAISAALRIPTIGIGAGPHTSGQVLVSTDLANDVTSPAHVSAVLHEMQASEHTTRTVDLAKWPAGPKFVRSFAAPHSLAALRIEAYRAFCDAVRNRTYPDLATESYRIKTDAWEAFQARFTHTP